WRPQYAFNSKRRDTGTSSTCNCPGFRIRFSTDHADLRGSGNHERRCRLADNPVSRRATGARFRQSRAWKRNSWQITKSPRLGHHLESPYNASGVPSYTASYTAYWCVPVIFLKFLSAARTISKIGFAYTINAVRGQR